MNARVRMMSALALALAAGASVAAEDWSRFDSGAISGLDMRNIGSATMSGRVAALDAVNEKDGKITIFVGAASGGVWKSDDGGTTFAPVFDKQPVQSIGAITIDDRNHDVIWVGTGEPWTRNSVSIGNGIYRSDDGGDTWQYLGLPESERISAILVDPRDSRTVYACVPGKLWSDSPDRGLYKTTDNGRHWSLVLAGTNLSTGCASVAMDPKQPDSLFASLWDFRRKGWEFRSGGESADAPSGSGLFHSRDGGAHWTELTPGANAGLPEKPYGRIALAIAPSDPKIVYALIESTDSALYRSDDGGQTWEARDKSQMMVWRPFYFANLIVDPTNPDRLFKPDLGLIMSVDGGKSFSDVSGGTHGDHHVEWINPEDPMHVITGDDGGLWQSRDGGNTWWMQNNLPISQFYHVSVDQADPFRVYGGLQDNSSWVGQSAYPGGITNSQWENMYGGDGMWMWADPSDPDYLYAEYQGGTIARINRHTHEMRSIQPTADYGEKLRFNWNTPIALSPNENGTIYIGAQYLFRSRDQGQSWDRISPDLTTNDPERQQQEHSGGITVDNSAAEMNTTIYSISESPRQAGLIWVGTDDGNVQLTRDGGANWTNVIDNIDGVPRGSWVSWVEASRFDPAAAFVAFDRHTFGDMAPYIYATDDYGRHWHALVTPDDDKGLRGYVHIIRQDPVKAGLLYAGTEFGLWISIDGGGHWAQFKGGDFPAVAVRDIAIQDRDHDLVLATHGRGIWIIDDITPLRALSPEILNSEFSFLPSRPIQQRIESFGGWSEGDATFTGPNPPEGAVITWYQKSRHLFGKIGIEILDGDGKLIDTVPASVRRGINRVTWNMRLDPPRTPPAAQLAFNATRGPRVVPGTYTVRLTKGEQSHTEPMTIGLDRRVQFSVADRQAQFDAAMQVRELFGDMTDLVFQLNAVRGQAATMAGKLPADDPLRAQLDALAGKADGFRQRVVATTQGGAITGELRLREYTDDLYGSIMSYEGRPADYQIERIGVLRHQLRDVEDAFDQLESGDLATANAALGKRGLGTIQVPPAAPPQASSSSGAGEHRNPFERD